VQSIGTPLGINESVGDSVGIELSNSLGSELALGNKLVLGIALGTELALGSRLTLGAALGDKLGSELGKELGFELDQQTNSRCAINHHQQKDDDDGNNIINDRHKSYYLSNSITNDKLRSSIVVMKFRKSFFGIVICSCINKDCTKWNDNTLVLLNNEKLVILTVIQIIVAPR
jgi:hypothetical protein